MSVIIWIAEGTWPACVAAARDAAEGADLVLLHVTDDAVAEAAHGAFAGLLGRGHRECDPGTRLEGSRGPPPTTSSRRPNGAWAARPAAWTCAAAPNSRSYAPPRAPSS